MNYKIFNFLFLIAGLMFLDSCCQNIQQESKIRNVVDTVGFATSRLANGQHYGQN